MSLENQEAIKLYMEAAKEALEVAAYTFHGGYYGVAVNRAYYAFFYTASALLLTKDISRSKHVGVLAAFRQFFVKPGAVEAKYGETFGRIFELRNDVDYDLITKASEDEARYLLQQTQAFVEHIHGYLERNGFYGT